MRRRQQLLAIVSCVLLSLCLVAQGYAQSDRASITGTVTDGTGAVVPGVKVTATNVGTNSVFEAQSNELGFYTILNLPIGGYNVTFSRDGFKTFQRTGLTLAISQVAQINVALEVGSQAETVLVNEQAPLLQASDASLTTNLTNGVVTDLPLSISGGRSLSTFMFAYVPGVEGSDYSSHINGSTAMSKEVMIDGVSAVSQLGGYLSESQPPMEAVQEFQVQTSGIRADEGRSGGGVFRYEMKSGTNEIHGSLFGFLRNQVLDANSWWNNYQGNERATDNMSQWGGGVGGPILKNKLFFFGSYERYMTSNASLGSYSGIVPTTEFLNGDMSSLLNTGVVLGTDSLGNTIYQGSLFYPEGAKCGTPGTVIVGNQISTDCFSSVSSQIVDIYKEYYEPLPTIAGSALNNAMPANSPSWEHINMASGKIDYDLSPRHRLSGVYIYNISPRVLNDQGGIWSTKAVHGGPLANAYSHEVHSPSIRISDSFTFTPQVLNAFHWALNRFYNPSKAVSQSGKWDSVLGLGDFGAGNFPYTSFAGSSYTNNNITTIGSEYNDFYAGNTFVVNDTLSWLKGRHSFKFGGEWRAMQMNSHPDEYYLNFAFSPAQTGSSVASGVTLADGASISDSNVGHAFASFLLGGVQSASLPQPNRAYGRRKTLSFFASDDIKLTSKLTLNLDLRWDYNLAYKEKYGHWSTFDPAVTNTTYNVPGALSFLSSGSQTFEKRQYPYNFSPNIGAAYAVNSKTVVRGSYSLFYVPLNLNTWGGVPYSFNPGYQKSNQVLATSTGQPAFFWDNGYNVETTDVAQNPNYLKWGMVRIDPRALEAGNTQQWMASVQRELSKDFRLEVTFLQNHGYHLQSGYLAGNVPTIANYQKMAANCTAVDGQPFNPSCPATSWISDASGAASAGVSYPYSGFSGSAYFAETPFPQVAATYGPLYYVGTPLGNSDYKSLQISLTKRATHGVSLQASYVLSAAHGDSDTSFSELWSTGSIQNLEDLGHEKKSIASFDQTHVVKGYVTYSLPVGRGRTFLANGNRVVDGVIGGWDLNFDFHYNSGSPLQVHSVTTLGLNGLYMDTVKGCKLRSSFHKLGDSYFNPDCFADPKTDGNTSYLGNSGNYISSLRGFGMATEDLGVHKSFGWGNDGKYTFTLRGEFFNIFNRHSYAGPDTSPTSASFGKVTSGGGSPGARTGQVGARLTF
jgi:hypothetical protein